MKAAHLFALLPLLATAALAIPHDGAHHHAAHARHAAIMQKRQGQGRPVMTEDVFGSVNPFEAQATTPTTAGSPSTTIPAGNEQTTSVAPTTAPTSSPTGSGTFGQAEETTSAQTTRDASPSPVASSAQSAASGSSSAADPLASGVSPSPAAASASTAAITTSSSASASGPSTILAVPMSSSPSTSTVIVTSTLRSSRSSSSSATPVPSTSSDASKDGEAESKGGLSKSALIAIIVVASCVGAIAIGWTLFRKWKLGPSKRGRGGYGSGYGEKGIDFSPTGGTGMDDDFLEKRLQRSASNASADRQRQALVAELDHSPHGNANYVAGVPEHDFTAGAGVGYAGGAGVGAGGGYGAYQSQAYDDYYASQQHGGDVHGYPPLPHDHAHGYAHAHAQDGYDYPGQDGQDAYGQQQGAIEAGAGAGYTDLKRGDSVGAYSHPSTAGYGAAAPQQYQQSQQQQGYADFPESGNYLGRPTGGAEGPYAQAAQYRY